MYEVRKRVHIMAIYESVRILYKYTGDMIMSQWITHVIKKVAHEKREKKWITNFFWT